MESHFVIQSALLKHSLMLGAGTNQIINHREEFFDLVKDVREGFSETIPKDELKLS